ncbi:MAG: alpha/beta hydrolase [Actinomycetota bacterium]|nr:alpha/beta hydrolase [Actinomycetota bacterium]
MIDPVHSPRSGWRGWVGRPLWLEARVPIERRRLRRSRLWHGHELPDGRGRPVLIIPGFMSGPQSAAPLAHVLNTSGWRAQIADIGRNAGPAYDSVDAAARNLRVLADETSRPVAVVGHSRGGQFGRVLAYRHPELVHRVVAVTSPLRTKYPPFFLVKVPAETLDRVWRAGVFGAVYPDREQAVDDDRYRRLSDQIDLVSIYSRTDGILDWRYAFDQQARMVEIDATHLGVMQSIAGVQAIAAELDRPIAVEPLRSTQLGQ